MAHRSIEANRLALHPHSGVVDICSHTRTQPLVAKEFVMQQTPYLSHRLFRGIAAATAEGQEPATNAVNPSMAPSFAHQLYFASLYHPGRALTFPCNRCGEVPLDGLSERARNSYFFARTAVGRDYSVPTVIALEHDSTHCSEHSTTPPPS